MANNTSTDDEQGQIYQWLSSVKDADQTLDKIAADTKQQGWGVTAMATTPLISLESPGDLPGITRSTHRKRSIDHRGQSRESLHIQSPTRNQDRNKRARHSYERKPRHKTHDDHYEYKEPSAAASRPLVRKGKAKNGHGRKHTLNDDFQAVNVTGNRLTIPNQARLGIFNKGKTSSTADHPTRSSEESRRVRLSLFRDDLLSRKKTTSPGAMLTAAEDTPFMQHEKPTQSKGSIKLSSNNASKTHTGNSFHRSAQQFALSPMPLSSFACAPTNKISLASKPCVCTLPGIQVEKGGISEQSSSPYTWPESEAQDTLRELALQQYLLEVLHSGLDPHAASSVTSDHLPSLRYWSLAELWMLLEERKASWSTETDKKQPVSLNPKSRDQSSAKQAVQPSFTVVAPSPQGLVCADVNPQATSNSRVALDLSHGGHSGFFFRGDKGHPHQPRGRCGDVSSEIIEDCNSSGASPEGRQSPPRAKAEYFSTFPQQEFPKSASFIDLEDLDHVEDDDSFYETLDTAYHAIIGPDAAGQDDVLEAPDSPVLLGSSRFNEASDPFTTPQSTGDMSVVLATQLEKIEQPPPLAQSIKPERADTESLRLSHQDKRLRNSSKKGGLGQNTILPWLTGYNNPKILVPTSSTLEQNQDPDLSHFWRHNRLY
ncbi:uncharacterized protein N7511_004508 [Penicillium nucicola]|uniref:uncharacterized protein n=1 Tax=Penicillium nucicola TaxID=1850975 RepID=UPI0025450901|nr:uncharacterized protein N7511_004508 [Penicillium nucicola]KAJ5766892.1 hypothetical protein N7511_004508 [Penicillium nucicola]